MYKLQGKLEFQGLPISVENKKGSKRHWYDPNSGEKGSTTMKYPYGYIRGTLGVDGDEVDVFVGPDESSSRVFIVTQLKKPDFKEVDEQKVMLGFTTASAAKKAYLEHYNSPKFFGSMKELTMEAFKEKLETHKGELIKHLRGSTYHGKFDSLCSSTQERFSMPDSSNAVDILKGLTSRMLGITTKHYDKPIPVEEPSAGETRSLTGPEVARALVVSRQFEAPIAPIVSVRAPMDTQPAAPDALHSCGGCGYLHKSLSTCPRCDRLRAADQEVSKPFWRR